LNWIRIQAVSVVSSSVWAYLSVSRPDLGVSAPYPVSTCPGSLWIPPKVSEYLDTVALDTHIRGGHAYPRCIRRYPVCVDVSSVCGRPTPHMRGSHFRMAQQVFQGPPRTHAAHACRAALLTAICDARGRMGGLEACKTKGERAIFRSHHMGGLCAEFGDLPARLGHGPAHLGPLVSCVCCVHAC
jgi:hypothetical protein